MTVVTLKKKTVYEILTPTGQSMGDFMLAEEWQGMCLFRQVGVMDRTIVVDRYGTSFERLFEPEDAVHVDVIVQKASPDLVEFMQRCEGNVGDDDDQEAITPEDVAETELPPR